MTTEPNFETAVIKINPILDIGVVALKLEVIKLLEFAQGRVILSNDDVKAATDDLGLLQKLRKAVEEKRKEFTGPINEHLKFINDDFKMLSSPLEDADKITRNKVMAFRYMQDKKQKEAEEINRQKESLAQREAAFNGTGEVTIDTTPVIVPAAAPAHVRTETGTLGTSKVHKWELQDLTLVPAEYKMLDASKVAAVVKASKGTIIIPGIKVWSEDTLTVRSK
ncbi:MAG: hypothetical protein PHN44_05750 [Candidatus Marinimicrobia bacterium]|nr:hypothetical protein [Candidatus Neomarinimicrobiota bacterium]